MKYSLVKQYVLPVAHVFLICAMVLATFSFPSASKSAEGDGLQEDPIIAEANADFLIGKLWARSDAPGLVFMEGITDPENVVNLNVVNEAFGASTQMTFIVELANPDAATLTVESDSIRVETFEKQLILNHPVTLVTLRGIPQGVNIIRLDTFDAAGVAQAHYLVVVTSGGIPVQDPVPEAAQLLDSIDIKTAQNVSVRVALETRETFNANDAFSGFSMSPYVDVTIVPIEQGTTVDVVPLTQGTTLTELVPDDSFPGVSYEARLELVPGDNKFQIQPSTQDGVLGQDYVVHVSREIGNPVNTLSSLIVALPVADSSEENLSAELLDKGTHDPDREFVLNDVNEGFAQADTLLFTIFTTDPRSTLTVDLDTDALVDFEEQFNGRDFEYRLTASDFAQGENTFTFTVTPVNGNEGEQQVYTVTFVAPAQAPDVFDPENLDIVVVGMNPKIVETEFEGTLFSAVVYSANTTDDITIESYVDGELLLPEVCSLAVISRDPQRNLNEASNALGRLTAQSYNLDANCQTEEGMTRINRARLVVSQVGAPIVNSNALVVDEGITVAPNIQIDDVTPDELAPLLAEYYSVGVSKDGVVQEVDGTSIRLLENNSLTIDQAEVGTYTFSTWDIVNERFVGETTTVDVSALPQEEQQAEPQPAPAVQNNESASSGGGSGGGGICSVPVPGSIDINIATIDAKAGVVTLSFAVDKSPKQFIVSADQDFSNESWSAYQETAQWTFDPTQETVTLFAQFRNDCGGSRIVGYSFSVQTQESSQGEEEIIPTISAPQRVLGTQISLIDELLGLPHVSFGKKNDDIVKLQNALKDAGFFPSAVRSTGFYSVITRGGVELYRFDKAIKERRAKVGENPTMIDTLLALPHVKYGERNDDIVKLQNALKDVGSFPNVVPSTGFFWTITKAAVQAFLNG